ncbi:hypothetical protein [Breoghania sp.]|nr:hypothetical protein [Breoghania sp.]
MAEAGFGVGWVMLAFGFHRFFDNLDRRKRNVGGEWLAGLMGKRDLA